MADNAAIYSNLLTNQQAIWGATDQTITYSYDKNGALIRKETAPTSDLENPTEEIDYEYNLQGRLKQVEFTDATGTTTTVYTYNADGVRIKKDVDSGDEVTIYLIDPMNHTGYAQVLEETITLSNDDVTYISYVIGDDVIAQSKATYDDSEDTWTYQGPHYLLYDGHGSTRQLADENENIDEVYAYDAYGVNLDASSSPTTSLQYAGEHYDADAGHYYNRARWYNPANSRFNRVDPFEGFEEDPQSLHKYTYTHNNPANYIDPTGLNTAFTALETVIVSTIQSGLRGIKNSSNIIVRRKIIRKFAHEVVEELLAEGVYFLIFESPHGLLAYVGQSKDVSRRIKDWNRWAKNAGEAMSKQAVYVVGYVELFTGKQALERTKKFIREVVEQGFMDLLKKEKIQLRNRNAAVRAETAVKRFQKFFRTPAMKKQFKSLFKKVFPL